MRSHFTVVCLIAAVLIFSLNVTAQSEREDVIYTKDGNIYHGTVIEQIPNVSFKIEIAGGSVISIPAGDIQKIIMATVSKQYADSTAFRQISRETKAEYFRHKRDRPFVYRDKGYFFQVQLQGGLVGGGGRIINGYKINQYASIGIGLGLENISYSYNGPSRNWEQPATDITFQVYDGVYLPIFVYYSGDVFKKRITPFYTLEAGYSFCPVFPSFGERLNAQYEPSYQVHGGAMGSAGFGVRFYTKGRFTASLSLNLDIQNSRSEIDRYGYAAVYSSTTMLLPMFKVGIGF